MTIILLVFLLCSCECKHKEYSIASCTEPSICLKCNTIISVAVGHTDGEWIIDQEPTCVADGNKHQSCSVCAATIKSESISAKGHIDGEWIIDQEATCVTDGNKHQSCSVCAATIKSESISAKGHTDGEWVIDREPTCAIEGNKHQICAICFVTIKTEAIMKTAHTEDGWVVNQEPTCTENGKRHQVCAVCNETIINEIVANLGGHTYDVKSVENNGIVGSKIVYQCINCADEYEETIKSIVVSVQQVGKSSATMNGYGSFSISYKAVASGGYGVFQYKFEVYKSSNATMPMSNLTKEFSYDNTYGISFRGYENTMDGYILKVTVKDEAGNQAVTLYEL